MQIKIEFIFLYYRIFVYKNITNYFPLNRFSIFESEQRPHPALSLYRKFQLKLFCAFSLSVLLLFQEYLERGREGRGARERGEKRERGGVIRSRERGREMGKKQTGKRGRGRGCKNTTNNIIVYGNHHVTFTSHTNSC
jgi:hypothetical protein